MLQADDKFLISPPEVTCEIEHVHLDINIAETNVSDKLKKTFGKMEDSAVQGVSEMPLNQSIQSLGSLETFIRNQGHKDPYCYDMLVRFMLLLEDISYSKGLASIERKIILHCGWKMEAIEAQRSWVEDCISPEQSPWGVINQPIGATEILRYLSAAFRCGLYVNDRLCFDNKVQLRILFL